MILDGFLEYLRAERRYSENTVSSYGRDVRRFLSDSGIDEAEFDPALVSADDVRRWIISLSEAGMSASSVNRMTSSLRALFRWLRKKGMVVGDPFLRVNHLKTPNHLPSYIPESQMHTVMDEVEEEFASDDFTEMTGALIIIVFYSTGIRLAELAGIRLGDFSSDFRELKIHGKGGKKRVIPIIEYTQGKVLEYIERIKSENICVSQENYLFLTHKGKPVSRTEIYRIVRAELARAGVQGKSSPHVLRHTFATHMLNDGADIREIQEMLGHSSLSATQIYTHNSISRLKKVYEEAHPRAGDKK